MFLVSSVSANKPQEAITHLGVLTDVISTCEATLAAWLDIEANDPVDRLAFASALTAEMPNEEAAIALVSELLPGLPLGDDAASDLIFQINRRRPLHQRPDITINRVAKWQTTKVMLIRLEGDQLVTPQYSTDALRLDVDINTVAGGLASVKSSDYFSIVKELITLGEEVAQRGDV